MTRPAHDQLSADQDERESPRRWDVLVADDAPLFRALLVSVLGQRHRVREVDRPVAALAELSRAPAHIAILDIRMPPTHTVEGLETALRIREKYPDTAVLLLSQHLELHLLDRLTSGAPRGTGGFGYLLKERVSGIEDFLSAVDRVASGGHAVDPEVVQAMLEDRRATALTRRLTGREQAVLELMAQGHANSSISARLLLSPKTVEAYIHRIMLRLDLPPDEHQNRRVLAVLAHLRSGRGAAGSQSPG